MQGNEENYSKLQDILKILLVISMAKLVLKEASFFLITMGFCACRDVLEKVLDKTLKSPECS